MSGDQDGRQVFDAIESDGFEDDNFITYSGHEDDSFVAWANAAPLYRPLSGVLAALEKMFLREFSTDEMEYRRNQFELSRLLHRFGRVARGICDTIAALGRIEDLSEIDKSLVRLLSKVEDSTRYTEEVAAVILDVRLHILRHLHSAARDVDEAHSAIELGVTLGQGPMFEQNLLDWAELALDSGLTEEAVEMIGRLKLGDQLSTSDVGYGQTRSLRSRFQYWRLRHRILRRAEPNNEDVLLSSVPLRAGTIEDGDTTVRVVASEDHAAMELASAFDRAIRVLAAASAATIEGTPYDRSRLWTELIHIVEIGRPTVVPTSPTYGGIASQSSSLLSILIEVIGEYGTEDVAELSARLGSRFVEEPERWPCDLRISMGSQLRSCGHTPDWYRENLHIAEVELQNSDLDVTGRLDRVVDLISYHASLGQMDHA